MLLLMMQGLLKVNYPDVNLVIRLLNLYTLMKLNIVKVDLSNILNKKEVGLGGGGGWVRLRIRVTKKNVKGVIYTFIYIIVFIYLFVFSVSHFGG